MKQDSVLPLNFRLYAKELPKELEYSSSYGGQYTSDWCVAITHRGTAETTRFTIGRPEKEMLDRGERPYSNWHKPGWGPKYVAWAYCKDLVQIFPTSQTSQAATGDADKPGMREQPVKPLTIQEWEEEMAADSYADGEG